MVIVLSRDEQEQYSSALPRRSPAEAVAMVGEGGRIRGRPPMTRRVLHLQLAAVGVEKIGDHNMEDEYLARLDTKLPPE